MRTPTQPFKSITNNSLAVLQHFSLFNNSARNEGAAALGSSLCHNRALLSLNVGHNSIEADGVQSLCLAAQSQHVTVFSKFRLLLR